MTPNFKPGARVRSKQTGRIGTVVVPDGEGGAGAVVMVQWDGQGDACGAVSVDDIYPVRPPPAAGPGDESNAAAGVAPATPPGQPRPPASWGRPADEFPPAP